jgi:hypothetical protein
LSIIEAHRAHLSPPLLLFLAPINVAISQYFSRFSLFQTCSPDDFVYDYREKSVTIMKQAVRSGGNKQPSMEEGKQI